MQFCWIALTVLSLVIPWVITRYMASFFRKATRDEFQSALNNKLMELLGILVALIWIAVFAGVLVQRFLIGNGG